MQQEKRSTGLVARLVRKVRREKGVREDSSVQPNPPSVEMTARPAGPPSAEESDAHLRTLRAEIAQVEQDIESAGQQRELLKAERLRLQEVLGTQHDRRVLPRLKVEKTNGVPSLVAGARTMQRIQGKADVPRAGFDGAGAMLSDQAQVERFARSHGVEVDLDLGSAPTAIIHAFKGRTPLIELWQDGRVKHVAAGGSDQGDIRPGVEYDAEIAVPAWFGQAVRHAQKLSEHIPRPYVQIGWCDQHGSPVLTGIDVSPERIPNLNPEWDQKLGKAFDSGHARMLMQPFHAGALDNRAPGGTFRYEESL